MEELAAQKVARAQKDAEKTAYQEANEPEGMWLLSCLVQHVLSHHCLHHCQQLALANAQQHQCILRWPQVLMCAHFTTTSQC